MENLDSSKPTPAFRWILNENYQTSEESVREVFSSSVSGRTEEVEFTDFDGERKVITVYPTSEA